MPEDINDPYGDNLGPIWEGSRRLRLRASMNSAAVSVREEERREKNVFCEQCHYSGAGAARSPPKEALSFHVTTSYLICL